MSAGPPSTAHEMLHCWMFAPARVLASPARLRPIQAQSANFARSSSHPRRWLPQPQPQDGQSRPQMRRYRFASRERTAPHIALAPSARQWSSFRINQLPPCRAGKANRTHPPLRQTTEGAVHRCVPARINRRVKLAMRMEWPAQTVRSQGWLSLGQLACHGARSSAKCSSHTGPAGLMNGLFCRSDA
jgi:hypothetical protein